MVAAMKWDSGRRPGFLLGSFGHGHLIGSVYFLFGKETMIVLGPLA